MGENGKTKLSLPSYQAMSSRTFLFCSALALYPPLLRVTEMIAHHHKLDGHVVAPIEYSHSPVWESSGKFREQDFNPQSTTLHVHFLPARRGDVGRFGFESTSLKALLSELKPNYIWIHAEFCEGIARQFLWYYRFQRGPRIISYVAVNHVRNPTSLLSKKWPFLSRTRLYQILLWSRLDAVAACATKSLECARRIGLPESVPVVVNYLPVFGPEDATGEGIIFPWDRNTSLIIGFAGLLSEQKGWKVLLTAMEQLPERFKAVFIGDGPQKEELLVSIEKLKLRGRAYYAGLLPKGQLLATYPLIDVFVLPSITTSYSVEQFGAVLAEAMACGVPVIGSNSGAIPEVVGKGGTIVPEGNADALAKAIIRMSEDEQMRNHLIALGMERFRSNYSCEAYARSIAQMLEIQ